MVHFALFMFLLFQTEAFIPNRSKSSSSIGKETLTHRDITEKAIIEISAKYYELNPPFGRNATEIEEDTISTSSQLFSAVFGEGASSAEFQATIDEIAKSMANVDLDSIKKDITMLHFANEAISEGNTHLITGQSSIVRMLRAENYEGARRQTGELLHTLQDFYSHTNWIELGNVGPNTNLGKNPITEDIAKPDKQTCQSSCSSCSNLLPEIKTNNILTSGYNNKGPISNKCSHGNINKDTTSSIWSGHSFLHDKASKAAIEASRLFLQRIWDAIGDKLFAEFLSLEYGKTLAFAIDDTGSMSDDIVAAKNSVISIINKRLNSIDRPYDYVLVTFNDPTIGSIYKTQDSNEFIQKIQAITVSGGGDCPELMMSGTKLALQNVRPGSTLFVFTDAGAKDKHLLDQVEALALTKKVKVNGLTSSLTLCETKRKKRSSHTSSVLYKLSEVSGGQLFSYSKSQLGVVTKIIEESLKTSQVTLMKIDEVSDTPSSGRSHMFYIDKAVIDFTITVTGVNIGTITISSPDPSNCGNRTTLSDIPTLKMNKVVAPCQGTWTIHLISTEYSIQVKGSSTADVSAVFVTASGDSHPGLKVLQGKPIKGAYVDILVDVIGGQTVVNTTSNITMYIRLSARMGEEIITLKADSLSFSQYIGGTNIPDQEFRISTKILDQDNQTVMSRTIPTVYTLSSSKLEVESLTNSSWVILPSETLDIAINITNVGVSSTFNLNLSDSAGFARPLSTPSVTLTQNETQAVIMEFEAPSNASYGSLSIVTFTSKSSLDASSNFVVFQISVGSKDPDITAPQCNITEGFENCTNKWNASICNSTTWSINAEFTDTGMGVFDIRAINKPENSTFQQDPFITGSTSTIKTNYTSNCCTPTIEFVATDVAGNIQNCGVDYSEQLSTTTTTQSTPTTSSELTTADIITTFPSETTSEVIHVSSTIENMNNQSFLGADHQKPQDDQLWMIGLFAGVLVVIAGAVGTTFFVKKFKKNKCERITAVPTVQDTKPPAMTRINPFVLYSSNNEPDDPFSPDSSRPSSAMSANSWMIDFDSSMNTKTSQSIVDNTTTCSEINK